MKTTSHKANVNQNKNQLTLEQSNRVEKNEGYCRDLCRAMVSSGVPLHKLFHPSFRLFLEKYTKGELPAKIKLESFWNKKMPMTLKK